MLGCIHYSHNVFTVGILIFVFSYGAQLRLYSTILFTYFYKKIWLHKNDGYDDDMLRSCILRKTYKSIKNVTELTQNEVVF